MRIVPSVTDWPSGLELIARLPDQGKRACATVPNMQGEHRFKWGGKPIGIEESVAQAAFAMVERTFTRQWLEKGLANRVQETWARNDFLAALELYALGDSIQKLNASNPKKLSELVRVIRKGGSEAHGFLYEIHALAMLASSGCPVEPTPKAEPGFDAHLSHPSGTQIRWSFKNHDITDAERTFRRFGADLYDRFRQRCGPGALERLIVHAERHLKPADFSEIGHALDGMYSGETRIAAGDVVVSWRRLGATADQACDAINSLYAAIANTPKSHTLWPHSALEWTSTCCPKYGCYTENKDITFLYITSRDFSIFL